MGASSGGFHEREDLLREETRDRHRAIVSIMEELEAVDWYDQRVDATNDEELKRILAHNRDEEKEHAAMTIEWLRRRDPQFDEMLRRFLFSDGSIVSKEHPEHEHNDEDTVEGTSLGIGSLRGTGE